MDFDGALQNLLGSNRVWGLQIYPGCSSGADDVGQYPLGSGDVSYILSDSDSTENSRSKKLRDALAGGDTGDRTEWTTFSGSVLVNDDTWPVTIEVVNDVENGEVTFRFESGSVAAECVYNDHFDVDDGKFVVGVIADGASGDKDDFEITQVSVTTTTPSNVCVAYPAHLEYWYYGDCGETTTPDSVEECCEAALAQSAVNTRIDRWSYDTRNGGKCYFKCPGSWRDGDSFAEYPGFTEEDTTAFLSSAEGVLPGCGCSF